MVKGKSCIGKDGWNNEIFGLWDCFCWDGITPTPQGNRSTHHFKRDQGRGQPQLFAAQICALRSTGHIYFRSSKRHPGSSGPFFHFDGFLHTAMPHYPSVPWRTEDFFFNCVFGTQHPWAPCKPNKPFKSRPKVNRRNLGPKALPTPPTPRLFLQNSTSQIHPKLLRFKEHPEGKLSVGCFGLDDLQELWISVATCCHVATGVVELNTCRARYLQGLRVAVWQCFLFLSLNGAMNQWMIGYRYEYLTLCSTPSTRAHQPQGFQGWVQVSIITCETRKRAKTTESRWI